jgi:hypothetical protein
MHNKTSYNACRKESGYFSPGTKTPGNKTPENMLGSTSRYVLSFRPFFSLNCGFRRLFSPLSFLLTNPPFYKFVSLFTSLTFFFTNCFPQTFCLSIDPFLVSPLKREASFYSDFFLLSPFRTNFLFFLTISPSFLFHFFLFCSFPVFFSCILSCILVLLSLIQSLSLFWSYFS